MNTRNFSQWLSTFRASINGYEYYTDFEKIYEHVEHLKIEISILNSLVGSKNIETDFDAVISNTQSVSKPFQSYSQFVIMKSTVKIKIALSTISSIRKFRPLKSISILCNIRDFSICFKITLLVIYMITLLVLRSD